MVIILSTSIATLLGDVIFRGGGVKFWRTDTAILLLTAVQDVFLTFMILTVQDQFQNVQIVQKNGLDYTVLNVIRRHSGL